MCSSISWAGVQQRSLFQPSCLFCFSCFHFHISELLQRSTDLSYIGRAMGKVTCHPLSNGTPDLSKFKYKSTTYPSTSINKNIHLFLKKVTQDIVELPVTKDLPNNLTDSQSGALQQLISLDIW